MDWSNPGMPDHIWHSVVQLAMSGATGKLTLKVYGEGLLGHFFPKKFTITFKDYKVVVN